MKIEHKEYYLKNWWGNWEMPSKEWEEKDWVRWAYIVEREEIEETIGNKGVFSEMEYLE